MQKFDLYVGLAGSFGGAHYYDTYEYNSHEEAENEAYQLSVEVYESYGGMHGLMTWDDCRQDLIDSFDEEPTDEEVDEHYRDYMDGWISSYAVPHDPSRLEEE